MTDGRLLVTVKQAVEVLPEARMVLTFLAVPPRVPGGKPRRIHAPWTREQVINLLEDWGGADVSGDVAMTLGFGLCVPHGPGVLFIQTAPGVCPLCRGSKEVRERPWQIVKSPCPVCHGEGSIPSLKRKGGTDER